MPAMFFSAAVKLGEATSQPIKQKSWPAVINSVLWRNWLKIAMFRT
jgi:hypothetical protein